MRVLNVMFGKGLGGIEQAFLDYAESLKIQGVDVFAMVYPEAEIICELEKITDQIIKIRNLGKWDVFAVNKIREILQGSNPDVIVTHGNRAFSFLKKAAGGKIPVVAIAHNYSVRNFKNADSVFAITDALKIEVQRAGVKPDKIYKIPNMVRGQEKKDFRKKSDFPVIGAMGRFVKKKGFDDFIKALAEVKKKSNNFRAFIAGDGEEADDLHELCEKLGLDENIRFLGWVDDKKSFFSSLDVFCVPSLHEPFGIVVLEAFSFGVPVVTTDSEGPSEIARHEKDALFVSKKGHKEMADAIIKLLENNEEAERLVKNAYETVASYDINQIGKIIKSALEEVVKTHHI